MSKKNYVVALDVRYGRDLSYSDRKKSRIKEIKIELDVIYY